MKGLTEISILLAVVGVIIGFVPLLSYFQPLLLIPLAGILGYKVWEYFKGKS